MFLLDAYALIYRAYYALIRSPRVTSKGLNTSAIFGFCNTLSEILKKENPTHIAVCFDPKGGDTFRHEVYPEYKAQRDKQPEDITLSIPYIKEILEAYHIPAIEIAGYEADDVIGTLAAQAEREGYTTYMMTPDKDYGQLVTERVLMYRPALRGEGFEIRGPQQVCERYGISSPRQVIDLLALEGDASDNVPGCPGVGEKTAAKLIAQWGSVENLLDHTAELKGALQKKIVENSDQIRQSKFLVTIKTDVPLGGVTLESLRRRGEDVEKLADIYRRLEFRTFLSRLSSVEADEVKPVAAAKPAIGSLFDFADDSAQGAPALASLRSSEHSYTTASSTHEVAEVVKTACGKECVGVCVCATGDESMTAAIHGVAIATSQGHVVYVPLDTDREARCKILAPLMESDTTVKVSHDMKRDYLLLKRCGVSVAAPFYDTSVAHYLLDPEVKHTLGMVALRCLDYEVLPAVKNAPHADMVERCCEMADVALRLMPCLEKEIEREQMHALLYDVELPLVEVLAEMEWVGARIDSRELAELSRSYTARLRDMELEIYSLAEREFNIASPMQVGEVLFGDMKIDPKAKRTKSGAYSTTEDILEKHRADHRIVDLILKYRGLRKLLTTYINALPALVNPETGKIHTSYNQTVTATGRISSTNPNLQNIPVRSDDGREIRRAFIADDGDIFMSADYSQIELRLMAELSGDVAMVDAFRSGADIHRATAAKVYHRSIDDVTDDERRNAKTANFGIIYGISAFGLSERLGIPRSEAKALIEGYFRTYPGVQEYMDSSIATAREQGYVTTVMGRRRMLPDINSRSAVVRGYAERNAINAPLQGSAADIIKIAMVRIYAEMRRKGMASRMIMQVHDELIFNVVPGEMAAMQELVVRNMEQAYQGKVALEVSVGSGRNWLEAH